MSPKVTNRAVAVNAKVPTKLALKKNIRRSSIFHNVSQKNANQSVILVEDSSSNEDSPPSPCRSTTSSGIINGSPVVISDTSCSELDNDSLNNIINKYISTGLKGGTSPKTKFHAINKWIDEINEVNKNKCFDESEIHSNEGINSIGKESIKEIQHKSSKALIRGISLSDDIQNKSNKENDRNAQNIRQKKLLQNFSSSESSESEEQVPRTVIRAKKKEVKENAQSKLRTPWKERLDALCDGDSSDNSLDNVLLLQQNLRTQLNFDVSPKTPKYSKKVREKPDIPTKENGVAGSVKSKIITKDTTKKKPKKQQKENTKSNVNKNNLHLEIDKLSIKSSNSTCKSFLESLSGTVPIQQCDTLARIFRNNYKTYKTELAAKLFSLYNKEVFNDALPSDTPLEWSEKMTRTAGYCYSRKITRRTGDIERKARIVLASKILDSADRLRDTLIHEMCHAATWIINEVANAHGPYWKAWTKKAREVFPELPPIKVCHNYTIQTKYTYRCTKCGYSFGRQKKSLNIERKLCGHCYGTFEVLINKVTKSGETKTMPATPKKAASGFALFVKENYATYRSPQLSHGEVMKVLSHKFSDMKVSTDT